METFEQKVTELRVFGFTIIEEVLDPGQITRMRDTVISSEEKIGVDSSHRGSARHLANLIGLSPIFFDLIDHPEVLPYIEAIMGEDLILGSLNARVVRPGDGKQTLHSDIPLPLHRYGTEPPVMMNTVWPLHDYTSENRGDVCGAGQSPEPPAGTTSRF